MPQQSSDSLNFLIVDDELMIRNLVHGVLTKLGYTNITMAHCGKKALELIAGNAFDFIITDWCMEDMDGIHIVRSIRDKPDMPGHATPIIMLTANTAAANVKAAINAGVNAYMIKPFSAEQLTKRIQSVIGSPREFIVSEKYKGPDRRHTQKSPPDGVDKRKKPKKK